MGQRRRIGIEQALEHRRLLVDGDPRAVRHGAACERVGHEPAEGLHHRAVEAVVEAPRRPQGEHERHEGPFDVAGADGHHDERGARERQGGPKDPAHHSTQARPIREVHGRNVRARVQAEQVDSARVRHKRTHLHFFGVRAVKHRVSRREFVASTAAGIAATTAHAIAFPIRPPRPLPPPSRWAAKPVAVASANGLRAVQKAFDMLMQGADTLDAVIEGVKIQELDPNDDSVGYGGLPNAEGVVQLDASCMHGPTKRAGAVGALEGIKTPSEVAKLVLKYTNHIFLVGEGAKRFALQYGFKEEDLLTEHSREVWLHWRANLNPDDDYLDVPDSDHLVVTKTGTINCDAVTPQGDLSSVTTTSGLSWKIPGRVGDSPIIGAGQYCDNDVGAAGSTGLGEANIKVCGGFLTVEHLRRGMSPEQALIKVMERVIAMTEKRLLNDRGRPYFDLSYYAVSKDGRYAGATAYEGGRFAICD